MYKPEGFSLEIFDNRYAFIEGETWEGACRRLARQMAMAEDPEKNEKYQERFFDVLSKNLFVPGGRIWYNSGRPNPQLLNCFVLRNDLDSKEGWGELSKEMIITSMQGGGCGIDFSDVRPSGAVIKGQKGTCPGPVALMKLVNSNGFPVRAGGARRVALMFSLDLDHPDVEAFLDAKLVQGELQLANVSVRSKRTTEFLEAVKNDGDWELSWKGQYKKKISAKKLWDKIVRNAYNSAEPGFLNWELVENESNIHYIEKLVTTNPSLRKGTKVITTEGIFPIEELQDKSIIVNNLNGVKSPAKCFLSGKNKELYRIKLNTGIEYFCTPEHKWAILTHNGPKKVETTEIQAGDRFPVIKNDTLFEGTKGSYEDGFTVGWLYGDGWITTRKDTGKTQYGFIVSKKDQTDNIHIRISNYLKNITGKEYKGSLRDGNIEFNVSGGLFKEHFDKLGVKHKSEGLPSLVWKNGSEEFRKGIIDGLYSSDGHAGTSKLKRIIYTSSKKSLAYDISELLGFYGIKNRIEYKQKNGYERYDLIIDNRIDIEHFKKLFNLSIKYKQERINNYVWSRYGYTDDYVTVTEIEKTNLKEDVWDISVHDNTHCFQLSHSITGNCGEIALSSYDCCCLGHLVLPRFVKKGKVDYHLLAQAAKTGVRFLDNVLTVNHYPLPEMKAKSHKLRRIGLGTTGLADMLAMLGLTYGEEESIKFIDKLYKFIAKASYETSVALAIEKGPFPACKSNKHIESGFLKKMPKKTRADVEEHGIRNCAILTQAPTGTVSIISGNVSSGIEPMFAPAYERRYWDGEERKTELVFHPLFKEFMDEGKSVEHFQGSRNLSVEQHMKVQKTVQKYVDNAVSKTINIPEDYPIEDVEKLWREYLPSLKGTTFYRENTRGYVDEKGVLHEPPLVALDLEEAKSRYTEDATTGKDDDDCPGGMCGL